MVRGVEAVRFARRLTDVAPHPVVGYPYYHPGSSMAMTSWALRIHTDADVCGEYVCTQMAELARIDVLADLLIGRPALQREAYYHDAKLLMRQAARLGLGAVDIALWDLAGRLEGRPIHELLGGRPRRLPAYASTYIGDDEPDGLGTPEAYADFAEQCLELGYRGFKIHPWAPAPVERYIAVVRAVGERVGGRMDLMLDPFCSLRTFGDALKVGRACDEHGYLWFEDPMRDGGVSSFAHRRLRERLSTPLLQLESVRGLEAHVDALLAGATDFVHADPDYDGGVTGVMKIAHSAEGFGLDVELHAPGPVRRQLMASFENSNYYEMALLHPKAANYLTVAVEESDQLTDIGSDGCVGVPTGPGVGVDYDWEMITASATSRETYGDCT